MSLINRLRNYAQWDTMTSEFEAKDHIAWEAADLIEQLEKQRDELLAAAKIILSDAPLDNGVMALAAAVRNTKQKPMTNALEKDLDAATDEATRGEI